MRIDLHNHTDRSRDGALPAGRLLDLARARGIACLGVTDHDTLEGGLEAARLAAADAELPRVIPGQEVTTAAGEVIGLYLSDELPAGLTPDETVAAIREQGGLVYLPHPFDTLRRGSIRPDARDAVARQADILEVRNGRVLLPRFDTLAAAHAVALGKAGGAGSDAHYAAEVGRVWVEVATLPTPETLVELLRSGRVGGRRLPGTARAWVYLTRTGLRKQLMRIGKRH